MKLIKIKFFFIIIILTSLLSANDFMQIVAIQNGMSTYAIARALKKAGVIQSEKLFLVLVRLRRADKKLKTGTYSFKQKSSILKVINKLVKGEGLLTKVMIPEGISKQEIALRLAAHSLGDESKFLEIINKKKLEGYLFPDTYYFSPTLSEDQILSEMLETFHDQTFDILNNVSNKDEIIIISSLIEKEAKIISEKPMIASVIYNRLKKRQYLQIDATVQYVLENKYGNRKKRLFFKDLKIKSPYNTYLRSGLPPGPICSPSLTSIKAALFPADTNYYFYVRSKKNDGSHIFSETFRKHLRAKKK